jgi:hypothetical protein
MLIFRSALEQKPLQVQEAVIGAGHHVPSEKLISIDQLKRDGSRFQIAVDVNAARESELRSFAISPVCEVALLLDGPRVCRVPIRQPATRHVGPSGCVGFKGFQEQGRHVYRIFDFSFFGRWNSCSNIFRRRTILFKIRGATTPNARRLAILLGKLPLLMPRAPKKHATWQSIARFALVRALTRPRLPPSRKSFSENSKY